MRNFDSLAWKSNQNALNSIVGTDKYVASGDEVYDQLWEES